MPLEAYLTMLKREMGLGDWTLHEGERLAEDSDNYATIQAQWGAREATLRLCSGFEALAPDVQRRVLVHELSHLFTDRLVSWVRVWLEELSPAARRQAERLLMEEWEFVTDAVERALSPWMPMPTDETRWWGWEGTD